jgi:hypothetical protein
VSRAYQEGEIEQYPPHHNWGSSVGFVGNAVPAAEGAEPELAVEDVELAVEGAESAVEGAELAVVSLGRSAGAETDNKRM